MDSGDECHQAGRVLVATAYPTYLTDLTPVHVDQAITAPTRRRSAAGSLGIRPASPPGADIDNNIWLLASLAKVDVLILDDWGLMKLSAENRRDLLEVLEDRHGIRSTIATSQLPIDEWHAVIGDPTLADAILDRLVHKAYKINLRGESMRKRKAKLTSTPGSE